MKNKLQDLNPNITIYSVEDAIFKSYGRILTEDYTDYLSYLEEHTVIPTEGNNYVAHEREILDLVGSSIFQPYYNDKVQTGYVNGHNTKLNALEWHDCDEINVFQTDAVLLLAKTSDIHEDQIRVEDIKAFYIKKNTSLIIFQTTLHFSPIQVNTAGFKCGVVLTSGTNTEFVKEKTDPLLFKTNKRILIHPSFNRFKDLGATIGIIGENIELKSIEE